MLKYGGLNLSLRKLITDDIIAGEQFSLLALDDGARRDQRAFAVCKRSVAVSVVSVIDCHYLCCCTVGWLGTLSG